MSTIRNWPLILSLILIMTSEVYLIIGISTFKADRRSRMRAIYLLACFWLAMWSSLYGTMLVTASERLTHIFWTGGFFASAMFFPTWLHFLLHLADYHGPNQRKWIVFFYASSAILAVLCILSGDVRFVSTTYGNQFFYQNSTILKVACVYNLALMLVIALLQIRWWQFSRLTRQRKQAMIFVIMTFLMIPPGLLFDFFIPAFFSFTVVPFTTPIVLIISLQLYYTMRANRGLSVTVVNASETIFRSITLPLMLLDYENNITVANSAASEYWGESSGRLVGKNMSELISADGMTPEQVFFDETFTAKTVSVSAKQGLRICDMQLTVVRDKYNDVLSKVVVLQDITDMQGALAQAQEASRAKGDFLSRMSHEIRTPMNAIIGMTRIGQSSQDISKVKYCLDKISEASKHLLSLINDILDMSKIEADKLELSEESFSLEDMLHNVCNVMAVRSEERNINLFVDIDRNVPQEVVGDELRLTQVINNFLSNAIKFTDENGSVYLNVRRENDGSDGRRVIYVEVVDTGIGISIEQQKKLFTSFEQADGGIARRYGGTGLGLAISKRIVELMGGTIGVTSEPGAGSTFYFSVPLREVRSRRLEYKKQMYSALRTLVIDDSPEVLDYFGQSLTSIGVGHTLAPSGEAAIKLTEDSIAEGTPFNLVFVDYLMEGLNGMETTRRIKALLGTDVYIVMISVSDWGSIEQEAKAAGVDRFLQKPLFTSSIYNAITELVAGQSTALKQDTSPSTVIAPTYSERIMLLVEDIEINREIVQTLLEDLKITIDCAENGAEAVRMFSATPHRYDIILMDVQMPEMDGLEATRRIRALEEPFSGVMPIVAMTANAFKEDVEACKKAGMNDHIGKPVDIDELIGKLAKYLRGKEDKY